MTGTPLIIGTIETGQLARLEMRGFDNVLDAREIMKECATARGKREHLEQMSKQTVELPFGFMVTFSVESGHPAGTCRHMSMSSPVHGRVPSQEAVLMVMPLLGFKGGLEACAIWQEEFLRGPNGEKNVAINLVQPIPT